MTKTGFLHKTLLPHKQNRKCGKPERLLTPIRKGYLLAAINLWLVNNGYGQTEITKNQYCPHRKGV